MGSTSSYILTLAIFSGCFELCATSYYGYYSSRPSPRSYPSPIIRRYYIPAEDRIVRRRPSPHVYGSSNAREWSDWGTWSRCNVPCGGGVQTRDRFCLAQSSTDCYGRTQAKRRCNMMCCPVNGDWGLWSHWSTQPYVPNYGYSQTRERECNYPEPRCNGQLCYGDKTQTRKYERRPHTRQYTYYNRPGGHQ